MAVMNDKFGYSVNFSKWICFTKKIRSRFQKVDTLDLEKVFYEVVRNKVPAEMCFEEFVDGLRVMSRKMVKLLMSDHEN